MRIVSIRTLRNRLRDYLQLVKSGEIVLVVEKGRVIAEIAPPAVGRGSMEPDALLAQAIREGRSLPLLRCRERLHPVGR